MSKCAMCGAEGNFCGYHNLGPGKVSLCHECAIEEVDAWRISESESASGCGFLVFSKQELLFELAPLLDGMVDPGQGYVIEYYPVTNYDRFTAEEFEGF